MIAMTDEWVEKYPIVSIEDGLSENDWEGFAQANRALGGKIQIVGDDNFVTNTKYIARGIKEKSANAVLIKLNQIGTVTETIQAIAMCQKAGWGYCRLPPLRGNRRRFPGRLRRRHGRRPDQDRFGQPKRADRQIQQAAGDRG